MFFQPITVLSGYSILNSIQFFKNKQLQFIHAFGIKKSASPKGEVWRIFTLNKSMQMIRTFDLNFCFCRYYTHKACYLLRKHYPPCKDALSFAFSFSTLGVTLIPSHNSVTSVLQTGGSSANPYLYFSGCVKAFDFYQFAKIVLRAQGQFFCRCGFVHQDLKFTYWNIVS